MNKTPEPIFQPDNLPQPPTTFPAKRIYRESDLSGSKSKRARKTSTPRATAATRVRKPKDQAILDIESQAKAAKAKYRLAQSSAGILDRIYTLVLRLTPAHRQALFDELSKSETISLALPVSHSIGLSLEEANAAHPLPHGIVKP